MYGRIHHFPWPDHHPPPFALIPPMMATMRNWLHEGEGKRVVVVHCKAGKGRSGTAACSYLISEEGWKAEDAMKRFTERRMRVRFGEGVSIPSQLRWVGYVDRWVNNMGKMYVERPVEIMEIHVWGLRDGVKVAVEGYVDEGRTIKRFHIFSRKEREVIEDENEDESPNHSTQGENKTQDRVDSRETLTTPPTISISSLPQAPQNVEPPKKSNTYAAGITSAIIAAAPSPPPASISAAILRPEKRLILPSSDINIDFERRSKASYTGWAMLTSIAHIWFNAYFEGGDEHDNGVFETRWEAMDGIKGTAKKGIKALDSLKVVWRYHQPSQEEGSQGDKGEGEGKQKDQDGKGVPLGKIISEPAPGELVPEHQPADWRGNKKSVEEEEDGQKDGGKNGEK